VTLPCSGVTLTPEAAAVHFTTEVLETLVTETEA
jgi:hypothetical protein